MRRIAGKTATKDNTRHVNWSVVKLLLYLRFINIRFRLFISVTLSIAASFSLNNAECSKICENGGIAKKDVECKITGPNISVQCTIKNLNATNCTFVKENNITKLCSNFAAFDLSKELACGSVCPLDSQAGE